MAEDRREREPGEAVPSEAVDDEVDERIRRTEEIRKQELRGPRGTGDEPEGWKRDQTARSRRWEEYEEEQVERQREL